MASRNAKRAAFFAIDETCPHVDSAFADLHDLLSESFNLDAEKRKDLWEMLEECSDKVKVQTCALREALISAYEEVESKEYEIEQLEHELRDARA